MVAGDPRTAPCPPPCTSTSPPPTSTGPPATIELLDRGPALAAHRPTPPRRRLLASASAAPTPTSSSNKPRTPPTPPDRPATRTAAAPTAVIVSAHATHGPAEQAARLAATSPTGPPPRPHRRRPLPGHHPGGDAAPGGRGRRRPGGTTGRADRPGRRRTRPAVLHGRLAGSTGGGWRSCSPARAPNGSAWAASCTRASRCSPRPRRGLRRNSTPHCPARYGPCCSPNPAPRTRPARSTPDTPRPPSSPSRSRCTGWSSGSGSGRTARWATRSARSPPPTSPVSGTCATPRGWSPPADGSCRPCPGGGAMIAVQAGRGRGPLRDRGAGHPGRGRRRGRQRPRPRSSSPATAPRWTRSPGRSGPGAPRTTGCRSATPSTPPLWTRCSTRSAAVLAGLTFHAPPIPIVLQPHRRPGRPAELVTPDYWARQIRGTVRFHRRRTALASLGVGRYLETRPRGRAHRAGRECLEDAGAGVVHRAAAPGAESCTPSTTALARLRLARRARRLGRCSTAAAAPPALPTYAFQRRRYWLPRRRRRRRRGLGRSAGAPAAGRRYWPDSDGLT